MKMKYPVVIKQSPLVLIRRIIEVEVIIGLFLLGISFFANYEQIYRQTVGAFFDRYDIFLVIFVSLLQLVITIIVFFQWHAEEYRVKEKEIIHRRGFFFSKENSILLKNVSSVESKRSPLEFFLNYGTIVLHTVNADNPMRIRSVDSAEIYANIIKDTIDLAIHRAPSNFDKKLSIFDLLLEGESRRLEFKQTFRWDLKQKIVNKNLERAVMKTLAASLNTEEGNLIIGITDSGNICGLEDDIKTLVRKDLDGFENHFNQVFKAVIGAEFRQYVDLVFQKIEDKNVCLVEVAPSPKPVYVKVNGDEEFFIRTGNTTTPLKVSEANSYIESHWEK
jgi:membrane protein YdbS with pleckstrin-like domain